MQIVIINPLQCIFGNYFWLVMLISVRVIYVSKFEGDSLQPEIN